MHPREVEEHFSRMGRLRNYWGGSSHATTQMLDALHYREGSGWLDAKRASGSTGCIDMNRRPRMLRCSRVDALVDVAVNTYSRRCPRRASLLPAPVALRGAAMGGRDYGTALRRARERLAHAPAGWGGLVLAQRRGPQAGLGCRRRCACWRRSIRWCTTGRASSFWWGRLYRFEAYTPAPKRKLGYYALPSLGAIA